MVKVKLGGITCDPDDTYYKQEKKNFLYLPEIKSGQKLYIGIFGTGAYQEMIAGVGGIHHCLMPEANELIIHKNDNKLWYNNISKKQTPQEVLEILDYTNGHNLMQYIEKYDFLVTEYKGDYSYFFKELEENYPKSEIFPEKYMKKALTDKSMKIYLFYSGKVFIGFVFLTILPKNRIVVLNYLVISRNHRNKGYGHIFINELKRKYSNYTAMLVELEKPDENNKNINPDNNLIKQVYFYTDLHFNRIDLDYKILLTGTNTYLSMYLYMCNLKNRYDYEYKHVEMTEILDEYFVTIFGDQYKKQYILNDKKPDSINSII